jgi:starch-binding outer membrane protein, SusD/RagB family
MKQRIKFISVLITLPLLVLISCKRDFLDLQPLGQIGSETAWKDGALATAFVTDIYNGFATGGFDEQMLASVSDEAVFTHTGRGITTVNDGGMSPDNQGWTHNTYEWFAMYQRVRACNIALENLRTPQFTDATLIERLNGEVHFLRGYYYHQLIRYYGAVPIVTKVYGLNDDYSIARNTWAECVDFIVKECDSAITQLAGKALGLGRANVQAARALKARILLYAASDLHDATAAKANSTVLSAYANPELFAYTSGDRNARWTAAKNAAKEVMDNGSGYKLDLVAPVPAEEGKQNYMSIAMGGGSAAAGMDATASKEIIFGRFNTPEQDDWGGPYMGLFNGPNGYHNWAGNTPIGLLVDDYEYMDSTNYPTTPAKAVKFDWNNATHKANPYADRDPRFYASILYDGAGWKPRDKISGNVDPANQIQVGQYDLMQGGNKITFNGLDTRSSSIEDWNGTRSGYYMRKFVDPDPAIVDNNTRQYVPWPFFRYTEAVYNYVEACIELGEFTEARTWLNRIRFRAGMPEIPGTVTGTALRDAYRNERRIEMAFEEQRYHDARRWMIAPATLGRDNTFINVVATFKAGQSQNAPYRYNPTVYNYTYTPYTDIAHENRQWQDKMYFRPIVDEEMERNTLLKQNPGYTQ